MRNLRFRVADLISSHVLSCYPAMSSCSSRVPSSSLFPCRRASAQTGCRVYCQVECTGSCPKDTHNAPFWSLWQSSKRLEKWTWLFADGFNLNTTALIQNPVSQCAFIIMASTVVPSTQRLFQKTDCSAQILHVFCVKGFPECIAIVKDGKNVGYNLKNVDDKSLWQQSTSLGFPWGKWTFFYLLYNHGNQKLTMTL